MDRGRDSLLEYHLISIKLKGLEIGHLLNSYMRAYLWNNCVHVYTNLQMPLVFLI